MLSDFSLLAQYWLPVRRASGAVETIRPCDVTGGLFGDPIVGFDWPRADFDAAAREFMIGLVSTACWSIVDEDKWDTWWSTPPSPDELQERFARFSKAFHLDGDGPRFMQDLDHLSDGKNVKTCDASALLIDSPGDNTIDRNGDLFVKRGRIARLGRPAAAMALYTLQTFAPSGGRGHRTSLRGGGPMTTVVLPSGRSSGEPPSLWHMVWANAFWDPQWPDPGDHIFPWLAPTRASETGKKTTPSDVHPAQAYWGMPRRIRLAFKSMNDGAACDLTDAPDNIVVEHYRTKPDGNNYEGWSRGHPLTPYYRDYRAKATDVEWLPVHAKPGRLGYRDWLGLVVGDSSDSPMRAPAQVLELARSRLVDVGQKRACRLSASGYDMYNMKARGFVESRMPLRLFPEGKVGDYADSLVRSLVNAARKSQDTLSCQVGCAVSPSNRPAADKGDRHLATVRFWDRTEPPFFEFLDQIAEALAPLAANSDRIEESVQQVAQPISEQWLLVLRHAALAIFDQLAPLDSLDFKSLERRITARRSLVNTFDGHSKAGRDLFAQLSLPPPNANRRNWRLRRDRT